MMKGEFIGEEMEVVRSRNESLQGLKGTVRDETKNTILLKTNKGMKTIMKQGSVFKINNQEMNGDGLMHRPEDRIKK